MKTILKLVLGACLLLSFSVFAHDKDGQGRRFMAVDNFQKMDADSDKKVSKEEWLKFHDTMFADMDKDGDGMISLEELKGKQMEKRDKMKEKAKENQKQGKKKNQTTPAE